MLCQVVSQWGQGEFKGHRDKLIVFGLCRVPVEDPSWERVDPCFDLSKVSRSEPVEIGSFPNVMSDQSVSVLVGRSLPRRVRITKEDINVRFGRDLPVAGKFRTTIPGQRQPVMFGDPVE